MWPRISADDKGLLDSGGAGLQDTGNDRLMLPVARVLEAPRRGR
jgi:hypothetical protein